jgi:hypothetical protein
MTVKNYSRVLTGFRRAPNAIIPTFFLMTVLVLVFVCWLVVPSLGMPADPSCFRPGLRNSPGADKLGTEQLDRLVDSLREKAGFLDLRFDGQGFLILGDRTRISGGSVTARALLVATVEGESAILLKNRRRSSDVVFARLAPPIIYIDGPTGKRIKAYSLEMDFSDFDLLQGDREAVAAFDPALVALHELGHAVLALEDDKTRVWGLGSCEEYINHIRRELGLPERQQYLARAWRTILSAPGSTTAEVLFIRQGQHKARRFYLRWETDQVGPMVESARRADPQKGNSSMVAKQ